jgi:hypothetical protein
LDEGGDSVVEEAFELGEVGDRFGVSHREADAPAGHRVGLGQGMKLDGALFGARQLEDGRRLIAVEGQLRVGVVVSDEAAPAPREFEGLLEQLVVLEDRSRGIVGVVEDEDLGALGRGGGDI